MEREAVLGFGEIQTQLSEDQQPWKLQCLGQHSELGRCFFLEVINVKAIGSSESFKIALSFAAVLGVTFKRMSMSSAYCRLAVVGLV